MFLGHGVVHLDQVFVLHPFHAKAVGFVRSFRLRGESNLRSVEQRQPLFSFRFTGTQMAL